jgi:hypothetical protein
MTPFIALSQRLYSVRTAKLYEKEIVTIIKKCSIPLYRTLNSRSKIYKCFHVYHQKEIKPFLPDLFKILSNVDRLNRENPTYELVFKTEILRRLIRAKYKIKLDRPPSL